MSLNYKDLPSVSPNYLLLRLIEQYETHGQLIIAYDFDDTVKPFWCTSCEDVKSVLRLAKEKLNAYFIVYTSNANIDSIKKYLIKEELPFDSINENAPFISCEGSKLFYNIFLDDKAGLSETVKALSDLIYLVINKKVTRIMNIEPSSQIADIDVVQKQINTLYGVDDKVLDKSQKSTDEVLKGLKDIYRKMQDEYRKNKEGNEDNV